MKQGLFESLTGHFLDGTVIDAVPQSLRCIRSIQDNLSRIFNAREGSLPHLEDYGLPDISEIYRKMPHGVTELQSAIKRSVERYEPRLQKIKVTRVTTQPRDLKLIFILSAEQRDTGEQVRFQTIFTSVGTSSITPWKKPQ